MVTLTPFRSELNGDRVQPVFRMANGRMATVSLTGIKSFVDEVPSETGKGFALENS